MATAPEAEFVLLGGRPSLDLVATLGRRHTDQPVERIPDRAALARWLLAAGVLVQAPDVSGRHLADARVLREAIHQVVRAAVGRRPADDAVVDIVNSYARRPDLPPRLLSADTALDVGSCVVAAPVAAALATVARDAVLLLGGPQAARIKECDHPDCSTLFVDETQAGRRRWCSMERCGNQFKVADYRRRRRS